MIYGRSFHFLRRALFALMLLMLQNCRILMVSSFEWRRYFEIYIFFKNCHLGKIVLDLFWIDLHWMDSFWTLASNWKCQIFRVISYASFFFSSFFENWGWEIIGKLKLSLVVLFISLTAARYTIFSKYLHTQVVTQFNAALCFWYSGFARVPVKSYLTIGSKNLN